MKTTRRFLLLVLTFAVAGLPSRAAEVCQSTDTQETCNQKIQDSLDAQRPAAPTAAAAAAGRPMSPAMRDALAKAALSQADNRKVLLEKLAPEIAALPGASAAFDDFLSRLKIGVTTEGLDDNQALALELTNFLGLHVEDGYKVRALARHAELFGPLSEQLTEEERKKRAAKLGDFDDVLVSFSYSPMTSRLGINLASYDDLTDELFSQVLARANTYDVENRSALDDLARIESSLAASHPELFDSEDNFTAKFGAVPEPERAPYQAAYERSEIAAQNRERLISTTLGNTKFFRIADLVANQPQLVMAATRTVRDELTGPEQTTFNLSFEKGFINVNSLRRATSNCQAELLTCYTNYLTPERLANAARGHRLTGSIDWTRSDRYDLLDTDSVEHLTGSLKYGRNLRVDEEGKVFSHADFEWSYEYWRNDPMQEDKTRSFLKLTFSQRINDDMSAVIGAIWANRPEFRGEVDKEVSARFGFTYRFVDKDGKATKIGG